MERSEQRTTFNPEAATFSPVFSSPPPEDFAPSPAASPVPQHAEHTFTMAPMFNYSPFHDIGNAHSLYRRDPRTPARVRLEDFLSPDVQALVKKLEEHPDVQEFQAPQMPKPSTPVTQARGSTSNLPPFTFPAPERQPDYTQVDINELSAGLGLPSAQVEPDVDASSAASRKLRASQAHPGALYGKLIGLALDKPLTAKGLAELLQNQDTNTIAQLKAQAVSPMRTFISEKTDAIPTKLESRSVGTKETPIPRRAAPSDANTASRGPSTHHQHHLSSNSNASYRHHTRVPSHRRYTRRPSRATKRMDQGPLPSAADIYPDDARFTPSAPICEGNGFLSNNCADSQPHIVVDNPFNWPPPAQVYAPLPPPSLADMKAADPDVLALMNDLPSPLLCTLAKLGNSHDMRIATGVEPDATASQSDQRALSPSQQDGSRYGLRFWGLGYGDQWELPALGDFGLDVPFRVRPREHGGWGGRQ